MLLKNAQRAVVDARKFAEYALNPSNPVGRHKARVFAAALREALPQIGLARGAIGAVVMVFTRPRLAYEVEFVGEDGEIRALATLLPKQISATEPVR